MKKLRKPLALLLLVILCLSLLPAAAFAEGEETALSAPQTEVTMPMEDTAEGEAEPAPNADTAEDENGDPEPGNGEPVEPESEETGAEQISDEVPTPEDTKKPETGDLEEPDE